MIDCTCCFQLEEEERQRREEEEARQRAVEEEEKRAAEERQAQLQKIKELVRGEYYTCTMFTTCNSHV